MAFLVYISLCKHRIRVMVLLTEVFCAQGTGQREPSYRTSCLLFLLPTKEHTYLRCWFYPSLEKY